MKKIARYKKDLVKRMIDISYKHRLGHLGSGLSVLDILDVAYAIRKKDELVILSNGHAGMALYVVVEKYGFGDAEELFIKHGVHPNRDFDHGIYISSGSLGQGLPIAVGMALSDRIKNVYCVVSDGECAEGSIWEAVRIASEQKLNNLKIIVNANGYRGYDKVDINSLPDRFSSFGCKVIGVDGHNQSSIIKALKTTSSKPLAVFAKTKSEQFSFLIGLDAHYKVMNESDYLLAILELSK